MPERRYKLFEYGIVAAVLLYALFLQFYGLGDLCIVQWDESRLAVNAAEMYHSGNFLVTSFEGKPDLYNTKPPLMICLQVISISIFGLNEFAIRFPSALAGILCIFMCLYICIRIGKGLLTASLAALLLTVSGGFIQLHGSLTGDYDSLLSLLLLCAIYHFYRFHFESSKKSEYLYILFLALAVMTKSAAAFIMFPILGSSLILYKKPWRNILRTGFVFLVSVVPFLIFLYFREKASEGYLDAIIRNDFSGRFLKPLEGHDEPWYYYLVNLFDYRFTYFIFLFPITLFYAFGRRYIFYGFTCFISAGFLIMISIAGTRIHWYDMPVLPIISIILALFMYFIHGRIKKRIIQNSFIVIIVILLIMPVYNKFMFIKKDEGLLLDKGHYQLSEMLRNYDKKDSVYYIANWYDAEFYFYTIKNPIIRRGKFNTLKTDDLVYHGDLYKDSLNNKYTFKTIDSTEHARKIRITGRIQN